MKSCHVVLTHSLDPVPFACPVDIETIAAAMLRFQEAKDKTPKASMDDYAYWSMIPSWRSEAAILMFSSLRKQFETRLGATLLEHMED